MTKWTELCRTHHRTETIITEELRPLVGDRIKHVLRDLIIGGDGHIVDIKYVVLDQVDEKMKWLTNCFPCDAERMDELREAAIDKLLSLLKPEARELYEKEQRRAGGKDEKL